MNRLVKSIGGLFIGISVLTTSCFAMSADSANVYDGIDLSSHQPNFDFNLAAQQGIKIVYLRTSLGRNDKDSVFKQYVNDAHNAGVKVGGYHFLYLGGNGYWTWQNNLANALEAVQGVNFDAKYVIDFEAEGLRDNTLTPEEITQDVLNFANGFTQATGIPCMLYTSTYFIKEHFTSEIKQLPIWIADYRTNPNMDVNGIYTQWSGFQYTDVKPVSNAPHIDADYFTDSVLLDKNSVANQSPVKTGVAFTGDRNVQAIQQKLNRLHVVSPLLDEDGYNGKLTKNATKVLQTIGKLQVDGVFGKNTNAYYNRIISKPQLKYGDKSDVVRYVQFSLGIQFDGIYGKITESKVKEYQIQHGLYPDGIFGPLSWASLIG